MSSLDSLGLKLRLHSQSQPWRLKADSLQVEALLSVGRGSLSVEILPQTRMSHKL